MQRIANPYIPVQLWAYSQYLSVRSSTGRVLVFQTSCCRFESDRPPHIQRIEMSGKKKSPTKKTQQEIREMIACLEECLTFLEYDFHKSIMNIDAGILTARINKLIGKPK